MHKIKTFDMQEIPSKLLLIYELRGFKILATNGTSERGVRKVFPTQSNFSWNDKSALHSLGKGWWKSIFIVQI